MEPFTQQDYRARQERVREELGRRGLAGLVLFDAISIRYLSGFAFIPTERPIALVLARSGEAGLFVPLLEAEHAKKAPAVDRVRSYPEYPGRRHPMHFLADLVTELGLRGHRLGADRMRYGGFGYRGPSLAELGVAREWLDAGDVVETMRLVKEPKEIEVIRECARWGDLAHRKLQEYSGPGRREMDVASRASREATAAMMAALGPDFRPEGQTGAHAGFRGQIGPNSALPHAVNLNLAMSPGDTLVTGAGAEIWGYHSELERTMFVVEPSAEQRRFFQHMLNLQDIALEAIRPGRTCADVDREVERYFEEHGLMPYWRHHSGHNIGLNYHEPPFLDVGDETPIEPGMLFTVEPGLYVEGLGGFRHSDTVLVTDTGIEFVSHYPRDLDSLIVG